MRVSIKGDVKAIAKDLDRVQRKIVPPLVPQVLNQVATRKVEGPAVRELASDTRVSIGMIRWKHDTHGNRTGKRRLIQKKATRNNWAVRWHWAKRGGAAGTISVISIPGRRQTTTGVRAGKHNVPHGFIAVSGRSGKPAVFVRAGKSRYPILYQRVPITAPADSSFGRHVAAAGPHFKNEMQRRIAVKLKRR